MRPFAGPEEAYAAQERPVGDARGGEDDSLAGGEIVRVVNLVWIVDAHLVQPFDDLLACGHFVLIDAEALRVKDQAGLNLSVQALHGRRRQNAFGRASDAHQRVNFFSRDGRRDARRKVAIADQAYARARFAHLADQLLVARAVQDDDGQIFHVAPKAARDVLQVVFDGRVDVYSAARRGTDDDLVHVDVGRIEEAAPLCGGEHGDGVVGSERTQVRAFERIDRDVNLRERIARILRRFEARADPLANDDPATHRHAVHHLAHRFDRHVIRILAVALAHRARRRNRRRLTDTQEIERQLALYL